MLDKNSKIDEQSINTIRCLSIDAIEKANSGHPGMPMGCAPIAHLLYSKIMNYNSSNPQWINRDRFILSPGHGSMLLYSVLHLSGYKVSLDDIKNFRQWGSITAGHPEVKHTPGVETTTGPLGQGFANAVGMAVSYAYLAEKFNKKDNKLLDHYIYAMTSDGEMMEGISHEVASFAGHNKLSNLIVFYDDNKISIDGDINLTMSEDVGKRYEAYGWHVQTVEDVNDLVALEEAVEKAKTERDKPSFIITKTIIGYGSPNKQGKSSSHGSPLGKEEIKLTKENLNWNYKEEFFVPEEVKNFYSEVARKGEAKEEKWNEKFQKYSEQYPQEAQLFKNIFNGNFEIDLENNLPEYKPEDGAFATRSVSGDFINSSGKQLISFIGGSADLAPSNNTFIKGEDAFSVKNYGGKNFHFGIREHAMGSIMNGMALYGGIIPYGGTFLVFSDYMRPAIRMAALCGLQVIYIFTHDSIGLGEDGPTHQPVEHLASLRAIPNLTLIRPADANETIEAWKIALRNKECPTALALTRQKLPTLDRTKYTSAVNTIKGAYIIKESKNQPDIIFMASGSEVYITLEAAEKLEAEGINVRVVSFPSWELFEEQPEDYKEFVLSKNIRKRLSIEAGVSQGWSKYASHFISLEHFGASAPAEILFEKFGFTVEKIVEKAKEVLSE